MSERKIVDIIAEPRGEKYNKLLQEAVEACNALTLIIRPHLDSRNTMAWLLQKLSPRLQSSREVREWPGTRLLAGQEATLLEFQFNAEVCQLMQSVAAGLYDWTQPDLPEDPILYRSDRSPWLVTIAHEKDGYLILSEDERNALRDSAPMLADVIGL